jgi:hypothetical protein
MQQARDRLADAEAILGTAHSAVVVSAAYYSMLYAARVSQHEDLFFAYLTLGAGSACKPRGTTAKAGFRSIGLT